MDQPRAVDHTNQPGHAALTRRAFCLSAGLFGLGLATGAAGPVWAEDRSRLHTAPEVPSAEALERLNLVVGWQSYIPIENRRDGIYTVQVLDKELLIQTRSGLITKIDAETGKVLWRTRVGTPYRQVRELAYNSTTVFAVNNIELYAIDRANGRELWHYTLAEGMSAPPVADEKLVYITGSKRAFGLLIPGQEINESRTLRENPKGEANTGLDETKALLILKGATTSDVIAKPGANQPTLIWEYTLDYQVEQAPIITPEYILYPGLNGLVFVLSKFTGKREYRVPLESGISLPADSYGEIAYLPTEDYNLYAFSIVLERVLWRFNSGTRIIRGPEVTDHDVYLPTQRFGLHRLKRTTGEVIWKSPNAERFLAANPKFVYALDRQGKLLVLDQARGKELTSLDVRDFVFPIDNERTDRFYLAAHNGLIVSLRDRDYKKPVEMRQPEEKPEVKPTRKPKAKPPAPKENGADKPKAEPPPEKSDAGDKEKKDKN
jgi:outer membrane protein assembly factor BamB